MAIGKSGDFLIDSYPTGQITTATLARWDFLASQRDVITLIRIHDEQTGAVQGRPPQELEALKRSALILAVTAWEAKNAPKKNSFKKYAEACSKPVFACHAAVHPPAVEQYWYAVASAAHNAGTSNSDASCRSVSPNIERLKFFISLLPRNYFANPRPTASL